MILDSPQEQQKRLSMSLQLYFGLLTVKMRLMRLFRLELRHLLAGKRAVMAIEVGEKTIYLIFDNGNVGYRSFSTQEPRVTVNFRSMSLAKNVIRSAMLGDQFWLSAMRDHRINVSGDMSVLLWFFALCRHLPLNMK